MKKYFKKCTVLMFTSLFLCCSSLNFNDDSKDLQNDTNRDDIVSKNNISTEENSESKIKISFYSGSEVIGEKIINNRKLSWNKSLYEDIIFNNNDFVGWSSKDNLLLNNNDVLNLDDYIFDGDFGRIKNNSMQKYDVCYDAYKNTYNVEIHAMYNYDSSNNGNKDFTITFKSSDGKIYGKQKVYDSYYQNKAGYYKYYPVRYLGETPKIYSDEGPKIFVGWDKDITYPQSSFETTAIFDKDKSVTRRKKDCYSGIEEDKYISLIHNNSDFSVELDFKRGYRTHRKVTINAQSTIYLDLTDGISSFYAYPPSGKYNNDLSFTYDIFNDYELNNFLEKTEYGDGDYYFREYYGECDYYLDLTNNLDIDRFIVSNNTSFGKIDNLYIVVYPHTELIILDGFERIKIYYSIYSSESIGYISWTQVFSDNMRKAKLPNSLNNLRIDCDGYGGRDDYISSDEGSYLSFIYTYCNGVLYCGNYSNPYLIAYGGSSFEISPSCKVIMEFNVSGPENYLYGKFTNFELEIPSSIKYIHYLNGEGAKIILNDLNSLIYFSFYRCNFVNELKIEAYNEAFINGDSSFYDCNVNKILISSGLKLSKFLMHDINYGTLELFDDNSEKYLLLNNGILSTITNELLYVPLYKFTNNIYEVDEGIEIIREYCFYNKSNDVDYSFNDYTIILPESIKEVEDQRINANYLTKGENALINSEIYYGVNSDGSPTTYNGINYAIYKNTLEASVISYNKNEISKDIEILDTVNIRGREYPVTQIAQGALHDLNVDSIKFGNNLKKICDYAFSNLKIKSNLYFPDSLRGIGSFAFENMSLANKIEISMNENVSFSFLDFSETEWKEETDKIDFIFRCKDNSKLVNDSTYTLDNMGFNRLLVKKINKKDDYIYSNDVSNLFFEIDGRRICFDKITEIKLPDGLYFIESANYLFPNLKKVSQTPKMYYYKYKDYFYKRRYVTDIVNILHNFEYDKNDLSERYKNIESWDIYVDINKDDFIKYVCSEQYSNYIYKYSYSNGVFYINSYNEVLDPGTYTFPLNDGVYTFQFKRYY